ncbi:hypothetical protein Glove_326g75 [Diversispora epigaea]|uniref:Uncharacterized protein n=1 Tax=Diversispora epigaea TaxID=1348612 RepID=A0A397HM84_9GLOM|nr:hypothetical protein Glove_326g75 [Diversispora epigaea]
MLIDYDQKGEAYRKLKKYDEALMYFNNLLKIEPDNALALKIRSKTYQKLEKYSKKWRKAKAKNNAIIDAKTQSEFINWIPYYQFEDVKYIAEGGFGVVNKAIWIKDGENRIKVALKNLHNYENITDDF